MSKKGKGKRLQAQPEPHRTCNRNHQPFNRNHRINTVDN